MHTRIFLTTFAVTITVIQAHQSFVRLALNNKWQEPLRFIRNRTTPWEEPFTPGTNVNTRYWNFPVFNTDLPESTRCGFDHMTHAQNTDILRVKAGDSIELVAVVAGPEDWGHGVSKVKWDGCPEGRGACQDIANGGGNIFTFIHIGPVVMHLSQVPAGKDVRTYDGSGEWVKIHTSGLEIKKDEKPPVVWRAHNNGRTPSRFIAKIPKQTPTGQYLLRADQIWPGNYWIEGDKIVRGSGPQLYPSCVHIEVASDVPAGPLPRGIKIPEDFSPASPGMQMTRMEQLQEGVEANYVYPGGPLWDGERLIEDRPPTE